MEKMREFSCFGIEGIQPAAFGANPHNTPMILAKGTYPVVAQCPGNFGLMSKTGPFLLFGIEAQQTTQGANPKNPAAVFMKGINDINGYGSGDQLIHVNIWTPKQVSKEEKETLEKLRESPNFKPKPGKDERSFFDRMKEFF